MGTFRQATPHIELLTFEPATNLIVSPAPSCTPDGSPRRRNTFWWHRVEATPKSPPTVACQLYTSRGRVVSLGLFFDYEENQHDSNWILRIRKGSQQPAALSDLPKGELVKPPLVRTTGHTVGEFAWLAHSTTNPARIDNISPQVGAWPTNRPKSNRKNDLQNRVFLYLIT